MHIPNELALMHVQSTARVETYIWTRHQAAKIWQFKCEWVRHHLRILSYEVFFVIACYSTAG